MAATTVYQPNGVAPPDGLPPAGPPDSMPAPGLSPLGGPNGVQDEQLMDCLRRLEDAEGALSDIRLVLMDRLSLPLAVEAPPANGEAAGLEGGAFPASNGAGSGLAEDMSPASLPTGAGADDDDPPPLGEDEVAAAVLAVPDVATKDDEMKQQEIQERQKAINEYEIVHMTTSQIVRKRGVRSTIVQKYLRTERAESEACFSLLQAVALVVLFSTGALLHWHLEPLHANDTAITFDIVENANFAFGGDMPFENGKMGHKSYWDVNRFGDFWSWWDLGIVPIFWPEGWDLSEVRTNAAYKCLSAREVLQTAGWNSSFLADTPTEKHIDGMCPEGVAGDVPGPPGDFYGSPIPPSFLYYHTILGGVELSQERARLIDCPDKETNEIFGGVCTRDNGYYLKPELHSALEADKGAVDHSRTEYLLVNTPQRDIRNKLRQLENEAWLDPWTMRVQILFTSYNPHLDVFTATYIVMFLNRSGHFHKVIQPVTIWMNQYSHWVQYFVDFLFAALIFKLFFEESKELCRHIAQLGFYHGIRVYGNILNFVDWVNVLYAFVIAFYWFMYLARLNELREFIHTADPLLPGNWPLDKLKEFYRTTEDAVHETLNLLMMCAIYPFLIILRFFHSVSAQPRLAMVTETLRVASTDILHFGLVFFCVFFIYVIAGMMIFGQDVPEYSNISRAATSTFQVLLGEYDWQDLYEFGALQAAPWFWTFHIFVNLIMLNMLLAIIMDVHTEVKGRIGTKAPTLWRQCWEIFTRWRDVRKGKAMSLSVILHVLDPTDLDDEDDADDQDPRLTPETFKQLVPGLTDVQAHAILCEAWEQDRAEVEGGMSMSDIGLAVKMIDMRLKDLWEHSFFGKRLGHTLNGRTMSMSGFSVGRNTYSRATTFQPGQQLTKTATTQTISRV